MTRWVIVGIGVFLLVFGVWVETPSSVWNYMAVTGSIYLSGASVALIGGVYWRRASSKGAVTALLAGSIAALGLFIDPLQKSIRNVGPPWVDGFAEYFDVSRPFAESVAHFIEHTLSAPLLGLFNFVLCGVLFVVVSLIWRDKPRSDGVGRFTGPMEAS